MLFSSLWARSCLRQEKVREERRSYISTEELNPHFILRWTRRCIGTRAGSSWTCVASSRTCYCVSNYIATIPLFAGNRRPRVGWRRVQTRMERGRRLCFLPVVARRAGYNWTFAGFCGIGCDSFVAGFCPRFCPHKNSCLKASGVSMVGHSNFLIGFCSSRPWQYLPHCVKTQQRKNNNAQATLKRC